MAEEFPVRNVMQVLENSKLDSRVIEFIRFHMPRIKKDWSKTYGIATEKRSRSIMELFENCSRIHNLLDEQNTIGKTQLVNIARTELKIGDQSARNAVNTAIERGDLFVINQGRGRYRIGLKK